MLHKYFLSTLMMFVWIMFSQSLQAQTELLSNNEFDDGTNNWQLWEGNGTTGTFEIDNTSQLSGVNSAKITLTNTGGGAAWELSFAQGLPSAISSNEQYELTFMAKASTPVDIMFKIQETASPWGSLYEGSASLTTSPQSFSFIFTPTGSGDANFLFSLGAIGTGTQVWIDNVHLTEGITAVSELQLNQFKAYPNPAQKQLFIEFNLEKIKTIGYQVFDLTGKEIANENYSNLSKGKNQLIINTTPYEDGIYLLILKSNKSRKVIKFVVKNN